MYLKIKSKMRLLAIALAGFVFLVSYQNCSGKKDYSSQAPSTSTDQELVTNNALTILTTKCSTCHDSTIKAGGVDVLNLNEMLAKGVIIPNEPLLSVLFTEIQAGRMPPSKALGSTEIQAISDWIALGFSTAPVVGTLPPNTVIPLGPTFTSINENILKTKCLGCHNATNLSGGSSFATYTSTMNTVQRTLPLSSSLYTSVAVRLTMPKGSAALNGAETKAIFDWITAGALNN